MYGESRTDGSHTGVGRLASRLWPQGQSPAETTPDAKGSSPYNENAVKTRRHDINKTLEYTRAVTKKTLSFIRSLYQLSGANFQ